VIDLKRNGKTTVLNTHNLGEVQKICDRVGVLKTHLLRVGTPEELRRSNSGSKTVIELESVSDSVLAAVRKLKPNGVNVDGNTLIVDVVDPLEENPFLIRTVVTAGGSVRYVSELNTNLEDAYLRIVGEIG
jgi:ABC-2 type transport system ATP-binding protein